MKRVRLVHWKAEECAERVERIREAGFECNGDPVNAAELKKLRHDAPAAVVIDLSRMPMQGRDIGAALRASKMTRSIPIVFVGGGEERVARVKNLLPDACYSGWDEIGGALQRVTRGTTAPPVAVESVLAGYAGTPLAKKLGIREGISVLLIGTPDDFPILEVPPTVTVRTIGTKGDLVLWFVRSEEELLAKLPAMVPRADKQGLWILWPKRSSGVACGLTQQIVRRTGLAAGLVDYKIASIDKTWAGLKFTVRR